MYLKNSYTTIPRTVFHFDAPPFVIITYSFRNKHGGQWCFNPRTGCNHNFFTQDSECCRTRPVLLSHVIHLKCVIWIDEVFIFRSHQVTWLGVSIEVTRSRWFHTEDHFYLNRMVTEFCESNQVCLFHWPMFVDK